MYYAMYQQNMSLTNYLSSFVTQRSSTNSTPPLTSSNSTFDNTTSRVTGYWSNIEPKTNIETPFYIYYLSNTNFIYINDDKKTPLYVFSVVDNKITNLTNGDVGTINDKQILWTSGWKSIKKEDLIPISNITVTNYIGNWVNISPDSSRISFSLQYINQTGNQMAYLTQDGKSSLFVFKFDNDIVTNLTNNDTGKIANNIITWSSGWKSQKV
jgi:hypothetical protein